MKPLTPKQQATLHYAVDPSTLEMVATVYGETVYIPRDRKPDRLIRTYRRNGKPVLYRPDGCKEWRVVHLHPGNIYRPDMQPITGDYVALARADGSPSENHSEVFLTIQSARDDTHLIETMSGECYIVTRYPELDTERRRAWKQVIQ